MQRDVGTVTVNSNEGIFGTVEDAGFISGEAVSVAEPEEVHAGRRLYYVPFPAAIPVPMRWRSCG